MTDLITKQDFLNEIEKWDCSVKKPTLKTSKAEIIAFYEQYKPREDNIKVVEESTPFTLADLKETGITEIKTNVGEEIAETMVAPSIETPSTQPKKQPTCARDVIQNILEKHRKNK